MTTVRCAETIDQARWDEYVRDHASRGPYHLFAWRQAIEQAYRHQAYFLLAEGEGGEVRGILPLVHVKPPLFRGSLVSQPFCDYGGILAENEAVSELLCREAAALSVKLGSKLEIRCRQAEPVLDAMPGLVVTSEKARMVLDLPETSQQLWDGFKSKLRSQIRKPLKEGLEFRIGSQEKLQDFYQVFGSNMRDLGSPVHSRGWVQTVVSTYGEDARVGVVYQGDIPLAAGIILCCGEDVGIPWASSLQAYNRLAPNMLLYWGFLSYACDNGYRRFSFGRSTPDEGTYKFKQQWGAQPQPLYWYMEDGGGHSRAVRSGGRVRELFAQQWARLPLGVANAFGPVLRRYITL